MRRPTSGPRPLAAALAPVLLLALCLSLFPALPAQAAHDGPRPEKTGLLVVAFGASAPRAAAAYDAFLDQVRAAFPDQPVRLAWTARTVREDDPGRPPSPAEALAAMSAEGFTRVAVQPLLVIPGEEFHGLAETCRRFRDLPKGLRRVVLGQPLLSSPKDLERLAAGLLSGFPSAKKPREAVVFVGHGASHPAGTVYGAFQYALGRIDPDAFVGTVEGWPTRKDVLTILAARKIRTARLVPLLSVAGEHAANDIAGDGPDSWKTALAEAGINPVPVLRGLLDDPAAAALWLEHLAEALARLEGDR